MGFPFFTLAYAELQAAAITHDEDIIKDLTLFIPEQKEKCYINMFATTFNKEPGWNLGIVLGLFSFYL